MLSDLSQLTDEPLEHGSISFSFSWFLWNENWTFLPLTIFSLLGDSGGLGRASFFFLVATPVTLRFLRVSVPQIITARFFVNLESPWVRCSWCHFSSSTQIPPPRCTCREDKQGITHSLCCHSHSTWENEKSHALWIWSVWFKKQQKKHFVTLRGALLHMSQSHLLKNCAIEDLSTMQV